MGHRPSRAFIASMDDLIDLVGAGCPLHRRGSKAIDIAIWDGRRIVAKQYRLKDGEEPTISCPDSDVIMDDDLIRPHAEMLVKEGVPFVTDVGEDDMVSTLRWTIE